MSDCFSHRMLNPFHGIVNVVDIGGADAVSRDGLHWSLYLQGQVERELADDGSEREVALPDIKFGTWSDAEGLKRAPVRSVVDYAWLDAMGSQLLASVKRRCGGVPFPLRDRYEYWLLDKDEGLPLALLASACSPAEMEGAKAEWRPGQLARQHFQAPSLREAGSATTPPHSDLLAGLVRTAAGCQPAAQWFRREADGRGEGLEGTRLRSAWAGRSLPAEAFPELLLRSDWPRRGEARLVRDFLDWQAPWLLTLQTLSEATRAALEQVGYRQALRVAELYRLYPVILDRYRLRAALVEAKLRSCEDPGAAEPLEPCGATAFFVTGN